MYSVTSWTFTVVLWPLKRKGGSPLALLNTTLAAFVGSRAGKAKHDTETVRPMEINRWITVRWWCTCDLELITSFSCCPTVTEKCLRVRRTCWPHGTGVFLALRSLTTFAVKVVCAPGAAWDPHFTPSCSDRLQGGPDSIRQFLIINNQSIQQHTGKWESTFCCR
jgi:hypothetical protein